MYEADAELEQALYTALVRVTAPGDLLERVERRLLATRREPPVPSFRSLAVATQSIWMSLWSIAAHVSAFALVALLLLHTKTLVKPHTTLTQIDVKPFLPITTPAKESAGGGGGGGAHDPLPVPQGRLPRIAEQPIVPPILAVNEQPKLQQEPAILLPKDIKVPDNDMPNLGDPRTNVVGMAANGSGEMGGMGAGSRGGIGPGDGNGYGPGNNGGYGGGVYQVGGGVSAPELVFAPDPEFSDEARRAKFQGACVVALVVDAKGNAQQVRVIRHLGMGLDQKAVDAVKQYKFKPAKLHGKPVPVEANIEVTFRIY
jgi:periplasmic protein TonB